MLLQLFFVIVSTRRSSSCFSPHPTTSVLHWQSSADSACHVACILIFRLVSRNCHSLFAGCGGIGGGLLYNDSGHRNQHFPAVQLEVLLSHSIQDSKLQSADKSFNPTLEGNKLQRPRLTTLYQDLWCANKRNIFLYNSTHSPT